MNLTPEQAATLAGPSSSSIRGASAVSSRTLAAQIAPSLAQSFRVRDDGERAELFRVDVDGVPRASNLAALADAARSLALPLIEEAAKLVDGYVPRRRVSTTAREIRSGHADAYLRHVAVDVRDRLPSLSDAELDALADARAASRRAARPTDDERRAARTAADAARRESDRDDARAVLRLWLDTREPGRFALGDVWEAWTAAVRSSPNVRAKRPGAIRVGRTTFYELLAELGDVRSIGARRRVLVIAGKSVEAVVAKVASTAASWLDAIRSRLASGTAEGKRDALYLQRARREADAAGTPHAELPDLDVLRAEGRARIAATRAARGAR